MSTINLKPTHKPINSASAALEQFARLRVSHETVVGGLSGAAGGLRAAV